MKNLNIYTNYNTVLLYLSKLSIDISNDHDDFFNEIELHDFLFI